MVVRILLLYLAEDILSSFVSKSRPFSIATLLLLCVTMNANTMVKTGEVWTRLAHWIQRSNLGIVHDHVLGEMLGQQVTRGGNRVYCTIVIS